MAAICDWVGVRTVWCCGARRPSDHHKWPMLLLSISNHDQTYNNRQKEGDESLHSTVSYILATYN